MKIRIFAVSCLAFALLYSLPLFAVEINNPKNSQVTHLAQTISYADDIQPLLNKRCATCHACYDAPCQLKLNSAEGLARGATKTAVYDGERLEPGEPTRLFVDAHSEAEWRKKGFFSVLDDKGGDHQSLLAHMLALKRNAKDANSGKLSDDYTFELNREQMCPKPGEFSSFAEEHPNWGMPYGFPKLNIEQHQLLTRWLESGAKVTPMPSMTQSLYKQIKRWEKFLNDSDSKSQLVARYLYEHLFLGHMYFSEVANHESFTLVRSITPPGQPLREVVTTLPYNDPHVERVYYRFKRVKETIVDKTHFIYYLNDQKMARLQALFFKPQYTVKRVPGYSPERATNPFETFESIPVLSRYQFLLDNAEFFISGFIKGPVCRGQMALNVLQDRFWVMFVNPEMNFDNQASGFLAKHSEQLSLPAAEGNDIGLLGWVEYDNLSREYLEVKEQFVSKILTERGYGLRLPDLWDGGKQHNSNASLTVFRHFDSATVVKGFIGDIPKTAWVVDYPIFERLHYLLVAGFNVYGTTGHQLASRKYMDYLRMDGENNFLRFMPKSARQEMHDDWYQGIIPNLTKLYEEPLFSIEKETGIEYQTQNYKREFLVKFKAKLGAAAVKPYSINECIDQSCDVSPNEEQLQAESILSELTRLQGHVLDPFPEISFLRVMTKNPKNDLVFTLLKDKALKNLSTMFGEGIRDMPEHDKLTVVRGFLGSYPNFFFTVKSEELNTFLSDLKKIKSEESREYFFAHYGIRRSDSEFWTYFDWFNDKYSEQNGLSAGIFDLNRYDNL